jgi:hypothetical protein
MENIFSETKSSKVLQDRKVIDNIEMKSPKKSTNGSISPRGKVESPKDQNLLNGNSKKPPILNESVRKILDNHSELDFKVRTCRKMSESSTPSPKKMKTSPEKSPPTNNKVLNLTFLFSLNELCYTVITDNFLFM